MSHRQPLWSLAILYLRLWGSPHPCTCLLLSSQFSWSIFLREPIGTTHSLFSFTLLWPPHWSWGVRGLCGGEQYLTVRNRVWVFLFQTEARLFQLFIQSLLFVILVMVCGCLLVGLRAALPSKLIRWTQVNGLHSVHQQSSPSPTQVSGSTPFFMGFISQRPLLTI